MRIDLTFAALNTLVAAVFGFCYFKEWIHFVAIIPNGTIACCCWVAVYRRKFCQ